MDASGYIRIRGLASPESEKSVPELRTRRFIWTATHQGENPSSQTLGLASHENEKSVPELRTRRFVWAATPGGQPGRPDPAGASLLYEIFLRDFPTR